LLLQHELRRRGGRALRDRFELTLVTSEPVVGHLGLHGAGESQEILTQILQEQDIMWRYGLAFMVAFLSLLTISTLSICLSAFADNSIGPIVSTMAIIILFTIIGSLDVSVFDTIKPYLFTTHMASWRSFFEDPIPMSKIIQSVVILLAHNVLLVIIAIVKFNKKDITS
jgi:ABC-2 type transport system permease protein